jgi:hypothetical protein
VDARCAVGEGDAVVLTEAHADSPAAPTRAPAKPGTGRDADLLRGLDARALRALQRSAGNHATTRWLQRVREDGDQDNRYRRESFGRPDAAAGPVGRVEGVRNEYAQGYVSDRINVLLDAVFAGSGKDRYHAGHLITRHLGGSGGTRNLVPMPHGYNTGIGIKGDLLPGDWGPDDERYSTFEGRVDERVKGPSGKHMSVEVQVTYGPGTAELFLERVLHPQSRALPDTHAPEGVRQDVWSAAMHAVLRHVHRTLRTIPFDIYATVLQGSSRLSDHVGTPEQLLQLGQPWTIAGGFLSGVAKSLVAVTEPAQVAAILATHAGYVGERADLPQYFDEAQSNRVAPTSGRGDYDAAMTEMFDQAPPPGILQTYDKNGLAGGVDAFIWMDPKGTARFRYGGSPPSISPKGVTWRLLEAARPGDETLADRKKMYVRAHLLNGLLHGPGNDAENLVPFVDAANSRMEKGFESVVKAHPALTRQFAEDDTYKIDDKGVFFHTWWGVWWKTRAVGTVQRPADYGPLAIAAFAPGDPSVLLAREEAKLPGAIEMLAYSACVTRAGRGAQWTLAVGGQIAADQVWNSLDGGRVLEATNPGMGADAGAIRMAASYARQRTFHNSAEVVADEALKILREAGFTVEATRSTLKAKQGQTEFTLRVKASGASMAEVTVTPAREKRSLQAREEALGDDVRLLDLLEAKIPVVDAGALDQAQADPQAMAAARSSYARSLLSKARRRVAELKLTDFNADLDRVERLLDVLELDGEPLYTLEQLDGPVGSLEALIRKIGEPEGMELEVVS